MLDRLNRLMAMRGNLNNYYDQRGIQRFQVPKWDENAYWQKFNSLDPASQYAYFQHWAQNGNLGNVDRAMVNRYGQNAVGTWVNALDYNGLANGTSFTNLKWDDATNSLVGPNGQRFQNPNLSWATVDGKAPDYYSGLSGTTINPMGPDARVPGQIPNTTSSQNGYGAPAGAAATGTAQGYTGYGGSNLAAPPKSTTGSSGPQYNQNNTGAAPGSSSSPASSSVPAGLPSNWQSFTPADKYKPTNPYPNSVAPPNTTPPAPTPTTTYPTPSPAQTTYQQRYSGRLPGSTFTS